MESPKDEVTDDLRFEIHKTIFENDLKKLNQILKLNKDMIDKKVNDGIFAEKRYLIAN